VTGGGVVRRMCKSGCVGSSEIVVSSNRREREKEERERGGVSTKGIRGYTAFVNRK